MFSLIVAILFALEMAYFATQNTGTVGLRFVNYEFAGIPMYVVVIGSALIGVLLSWFISAMSSASYFMKLRSKDNLIQHDKKAIADLNARLRDLEAENTKLKGEKRVIARNEEVIHEGDIARKPSLVEKLFPSSTRVYSKQV